jgi:hypothetical protein
MSETNRLQDKRNEHFRDWRNEDRDQREFVPFSHDQEQNQRIQKLEKQLREKLAQSENLSNHMKSLENAWSELVEKKQQLSKASQAAEAEHSNARLALNAAKLKAKIKLLPPPPDSLPESSAFQQENKYFVNKQFNMKQSFYYYPHWYSLVSKWQDLDPEDEQGVARVPMTFYPDSPRSETSVDSWYENDESVEHWKWSDLPKKILAKVTKVFASCICTF